MIQETLVFGPTWSSALVFWTLINRVLFCLAGAACDSDLPKQRSASCLFFGSFLPPWLLLVTPLREPARVSRLFSWYLSYHLGLTSAPPALWNCTSVTVRVWPSFQISPPKCCGSHEAEPQTKVQLPLHPSSSVYVLVPILLGQG